MKRNKISLYIMVIAVVCLALTGCGKSSDTFSEREIFALDTFIKLRIYGDNSESAIDIAQSEITMLEKTLSVTNEESDISKINSNISNPVTVSSDTINVLKTANEISQLTNGSFDVTIYPVVKLWGFTTDTQSVPDSAKLNMALERVDYRNIIIHESNNSVSRSADTQLDLGAIAKGYISEQVKKLLKKNGVESAILSFGGNIQTIGTKNGEAWRIGIKYPFTEENFGVINQEESAVVTSAADQRYFEQDGKKYHHIIDPQSGYPAENGTLSVTVVCDSGTKADALSTSFFIMGKDRASELYRNSDGFDFIILDSNQNVYVTEGLKEAFKLSDEYGELKVEYVEK